jgi:cytochrome P450
MPEVYPSPKRFDPRRWDGTQPSAYAYLPFGAGPRTCLGAAFASLSLRVLLAIVLQRFRLTLAKGARVSYCIRGIILGTKHGLPMRVEPKGRALQVPGPVRGDIGEWVDLS